jgi:hypothetical protein
MIKSFLIWNLIMAHLRPLHIRYSIKLKLIYHLSERGMADSALFKMENGKFILSVNNGLDEITRVPEPLMVAGKVVNWHFICSTNCNGWRNADYIALWGYSS